MSLPQDRSESLSEITNCDRGFIGLHLLAEDVLDPPIEDESG